METNINVNGRLLKGRHSLQVKLVFYSGSAVTVLPEQYMKVAQSRLKPSMIKPSAATGDPINVIGTALFRIGVSD